MVVGDAVVLLVQVTTQHAASVQLVDGAAREPLTYTSPTRRVVSSVVSNRQSRRATLRAPALCCAGNSTNYCAEGARSSSPSSEPSLSSSQEVSAGISSDGEDHEMHAEDHVRLRVAPGDAVLLDLGYLGDRGSQEAMLLLASLHPEEDGPQLDQHACDGRRPLMRDGIL